VYGKAESFPPPVIRSKSETNDFDFVVYVPSALVASSSQGITNIVNQYRVYGRRYYIQSF
jgi:hypothetical protein